MCEDHATVETRGRVSVESYSSEIPPGTWIGGVGEKPQAQSIGSIYLRRVSLPRAKYRGHVWT